MTVSVEWGLRGCLRAEGRGGARVVSEGARDSLLLVVTQFLAIKPERGRVDEV